jgi:hypothetical protein
VATLMAEELGRDEAWKQDQLRTYEELVQAYLIH